MLPAILVVAAAVVLLTRRSAQEKYVLSAQLEGREFCSTHRIFDGVCRDVFFRQMRSESRWSSLIHADT